MDQKREDEWLMHVAIGTDPLTALAALPRDNNTESQITAGVYRQPADPLPGPAVPSDDGGALSALALAHGQNWMALMPFQPEIWST